MASIKINGTNATSVASIRINSFQSPLPAKEEKRVKIQGKYGTTVYGIDWADRTVSVNGVMIDSDWKNKMREFASFLKPDEEVLVNISNDSSIFYLGYANSLVLEDKGNTHSVFFTCSFTCRPQIYKITDETVDTSTIASEDDILALLPSQYEYAVAPV